MVPGQQMDIRLGELFQQFEMKVRVMPANYEMLTMILKCFFLKVASFYVKLA